MKHVKQTLEILREQQFFIKASKCNFGQQELEYLGHIVTCNGVKVDENKIAAMVSWLRPQNILELRGFLGLTGYYRKFVQGYRLLARPLTNLLKKGQFGWSDEVEQAFEKLKKVMTSTPTLAMPNFNDTFTIEIDASRYGIGAVLHQQGRPIAYMSRALGIAKKSWSVYNKEMFAIVEAVRVWRPYLLGQRFTILTDQRNIKFFLEQQVATPEQQKWMAKLMGYDYEIVYRSGRENAAADALSRRPNSPILFHVFMPQVAIWEVIRKAASQDEYMQKVTTVAQAQASGPYILQNGLIFFKGRVVVPRMLREKLLFEAHDTKMGGHSGVLCTFKRLSQQFYWPSIFQSVQEYVNKCATCQKTKAETLKPTGLL